MADVQAARENIQKVVAFLVNRFGYQEDVFKHLTLALDNLQDDPAGRQPTPESAKPVTEEPPPAVAAAPTPSLRKTRRYRR
jgi:hypothetical protein